MRLAIYSKNYCLYLDMNCSTPGHGFSLGQSQKGCTYSDCNIFKFEPSCTWYKLCATFQSRQIYRGLVHGYFLPTATLSYRILRPLVLHVLQHDLEKLFLSSSIIWLKIHQNEQVELEFPFCWRQLCWCWSFPNSAFTGATICYLYPLYEVVIISPESHYWQSNEEESSSLNEHIYFKS